MKRFIYPLALILPCTLFAIDPDIGTQEEAGRRVSAHLLLRDPHAAVEEAKRARFLFPESKMLQISLIRALCEKGDEIDALEEWKRATMHFGVKANERFLLEMLAWGVLNKGENSTQPMVRLSSLIGACATRDAKAVPLLLKEMRGTNSWLRAFAVRLASEFGDAPLQDELMRLLKSEKVWYVRLEVIKAIGQLQIGAAKGMLKELIAHPRTITEERGSAIIALVNMYEQVEPEDLKQLLHSKRAGLRELACEIVGHLELEDKLGELLPLLQDTSFEVRLAALNSIGLMHNPKLPKEPILEKVRVCLDDATPQVAITAAWVMMVYGEKEGEVRLHKWVKESDPQMRQLASAAVAFSGIQGLPLAKKLIRESDDVYVQVNLAMGLIGLRQETGLACDVIYRLFSKQHKELWMWDNHLNPLFRSLSPSRVSHVEHIPHYPMVIDQLVKLDLLSVLSIMRYSKALDAVKGFLNNQTWGVSGAAAATLMEEGSDECLNLVERLLTDPDQKIRMQAAFIMAMIGGESSAIKVLQEVYPRMDRETKLYILEAIGHVGDPTSIPFLLEILKEPFQVQRLVAASALIQCLYH